MDKKPFKIFLSPPHQSGEELEYLKKALDANWLAPGGELVAQFESEIAQVTNRKHCVALNSGTAAIHLALKTLGVEAGDYVICQTFSFVATANPISYLGAHPVFVDSEQETWNIDPDLLERAITDLQQKGISPKAILYTHIYGNPAKIHELLNISEKYGIPLIEDAAEALGAEYDKQPIGQFGKISILSFNGNKVITTSGGGALLTDDSEIADKALCLSTQARSIEKPYLHSEIGYNYRMSNLSAAVGVAQLKCLAAWVRRKREIYDRYTAIVTRGDLLKTISSNPNNYSSRWLSVFLLNSKEERDKLIDRLASEGIESRRLWKPLHTMQIYTRQIEYLAGVSDALFEKGICLPSGVGLSDEEQNQIIHIVKASV